jgi:uncharacterized protein YjbI with pentapeptide repeats
MSESKRLTDETLQRGRDGRGLSSEEARALAAEVDALRARIDEADLALCDLRKTDLARIANAIAALRGASPQPPNPKPAPS